mgnify:FL=1
MTRELINLSDYWIGFSNDTGSLITNLKLQKILYYTQAWYLALFNEPLFQDDFEAWVHGPVVRELYNEYKHFSCKPIEKDINEQDFNSIRNNYNDKTQQFLQELADEYFTLDAYTLERLTHQEEPWITARHGLSEDSPCDTKN